jgi:hypothetical protein
VDAITNALGWFIGPMSLEREAPSGSAENLQEFFQWLINLIND